VAGDSGTAIGAALQHYYKRNSDIKDRYLFQDTYLGPDYSNDEIKNCLSNFPVEYKLHDKIEKEGARLIAAGKILGWFQGRMEFGPRALGNRSILTAPYPEEMKDILNEKVKHREFFRPFAPAVILEDVEKYFDCGVESPYMLLVYNILPCELSPPQ